MRDHVPEQRHTIERRLTPDRRRGLERRIVDRRVRIIWFAPDRRTGASRRSSRERRSPIPRRSPLDRRGSGIAWTGPAA